MTAASGIVHEEFHSRNFAQTGGTLEMCQLWINLPKKYKMTPPKYQPIQSADIPVVQLDDESGYVRVIAGSYNTTTGAATTFSPISIWDVLLKNEKCLEFSVDESHNTMIFVRSGSLQHTQDDSATKSTKIPPMQIILLERQGSLVRVEAMGDTEFLVLSGQPLDEPIAARGPFVMNTREELMEAMVDFQSGRMGQL